MAFPIENNWISGVGVNAPIQKAKTFVNIVIVIDGPTSINTSIINSWTLNFASEPSKSQFEDDVVEAESKEELFVEEEKEDFVWILLCGKELFFEHSFSLLKNLFKRASVL